jgi:NAD(P)-dependent dehydrogenase (short-subunit alcohol dehydrogenase family)
MQNKKLALITGASKGIGAAIARQLAEDNYLAIINYHHSQVEAMALVEEIIKKGGEAFAIQADISQEHQLLELFENIDTNYPDHLFSVLVNNAGINGGSCKVSDISLKTLESVFSTNVYATFLASREAVKRMQKHRSGGNIINISSEAGKFGGNQIAHYAASKAAINTFTIGFAREVAEDNIRVNTVSPGVIETDLHAKSAPERVMQLMQSLPMKRMGTANEVAHLVSWLCSDKASYISGAIIPVSGGR